MNILHFSPNFDQLILTDAHEPLSGIAYMGEKSLLEWLERQLGLYGYPSNTAYLRIELYRQALSQHAVGQTGTALFYGASFENDRFATATVLLSWRDELLSAGWDFMETPGMPERLRTLAAVEALFSQKIRESAFRRTAWGIADRLNQVLQALESQKAGLVSCELHVPFNCLQPGFQRLFRQLEKQGMRMTERSISCAAPENSPLGQLQRRLKGEVQTSPASLDLKTQLFILKARRDSDMAHFVAQLLRVCPDLKPVFLAPALNNLLELAMQQEGHAPMGIASASTARPSLQVLRLAPTFLWDPVDVYKLMEFLTLSVKPLDAGLALEMARVLADKPGLYNNNWFAAVYGYLESGDLPDEVRDQYEFWFARKRYPIDRGAPIKDAVSLYAYLEDWGRRHFEESGSANVSLLVLAEQARRIREVLEALPEPRIGFLELERIVRTIYQPPPVLLSEAMVKRFEFVHHPGAIARQCDALMWWNFNFDGLVPSPDKWLSEERSYLSERSVYLYTKVQERKTQQYAQLQPLLCAREKLFLLSPELVDGNEALPSLLMGDLEAALGDSLFRELQYDIDKPEDRERLGAILQPVGESIFQSQPFARIKPHLNLDTRLFTPESEYETPTNLENLFYYPHRWFFRQKLRFYAGGILSINQETTLKGNLAHRFFEELLVSPGFKSWSKEDLRDWLMEQSRQLLPREGAPLLLYGREPDRQAFLHKVQQAAWALVSLIKSNGWEVAHTELELQGRFLNQPVKGKADLVLQRGEEMAIVDLKWGGARRRKELIQNGEDLQLILYAKLLPPPDRWPHTAYFILDDAKMIARNNAAFKEAIIAGKYDDHVAACEAIYDRMEKTFQWRLDQLRKGLIEMRNHRTLTELEHLYEGQLLDLLEMKSEASKWDEYRVLLGG